ncbi:hypothetical protein JCM9279_001742 [Rhodotorula babjevae]
MLVLALDYDDTSMTDVLRRWEAELREEEPTAERHAVEVELSRKLATQAVELMVGRLETLNVDVESLDLRWQECSSFLFASFPHLKSLSVYSTFKDAPTSPFGFPASLTCLSLRKCQRPRFPPALLALTTLLLEHVDFASAEDWRDLLQACPSLEKLGSRWCKPLPSPGIFTSAHLPPSLAHICFDDPLELGRSSFDFLHDLPPTVRSVTVTQLAHYKPKERRIAPLRWACSRQEIELSVTTTGYRGSWSLDLEAWAARR